MVSVNHLSARWRAGEGFQEQPGAGSAARGRATAPRLLALILITAVALLWPAMINRGPFWFPDTSTYIRAADAATLVVTGTPTEWSDRLRLGKNGPAVSHATDMAIQKHRDDLHPDRPIFTGRSIYYGFLIYLPMRFGGPWAAIFVQALCVASILVLCGVIALRTGLAVSPRPLLLTLAACIAFSPLPFYTSMLMPDIYAALCIMVLVLAFCVWGHLSRAEKIGLIAIAGAIAAFHNTHALLAVVIAGIAVILKPTDGPRWRPILIILPVLAIAWAGSAAFSFAVESASRQKPISPPFLQARLVAAGPGTAFLRTACAADRDAWASCPFLAKLPVESDAFLWQQDPRTIVFQALDGTGQRRMAGEDKAFALAVLGHDPLGVLEATVVSAAEQLVSFDYRNFNFSDARLRGIEGKYPDNIEAQLRATRAVQRTMPTTWPLAACVILTIASLGAIAVAMLQRSWSMGANGRRVTFAVALVVLTVAANAAICGGLSGPHARYQMRVVWLLPFAATVLASFLAYRRPAPARIEQAELAE